MCPSLESDLDVFFVLDRYKLRSKIRFTFSTRLCGISLASSIPVYMLPKQAIEYHARHSRRWTSSFLTPTGCGYSSCTWPTRAPTHDSVAYISYGLFTARA